jgi:hypothetical protein
VPVQEQRATAARAALRGDDARALVPENLDSIDNIVRYVERKRATASAA